MSGSAAFPRRGVATSKFRYAARMRTVRGIAFFCLGVVAGWFASRTRTTDQETLQPWVGAVAEAGEGATSVRELEDRDVRAQVDQIRADAADAIKPGRRDIPSGL